MFVTSLEAIIEQILVWYLPVVLCYFAWPILERRRGYVVAAAVLCLTPMFVGYNFLDQWPSYKNLPDFFRSIAPLAVSLPEIIMLFPGSIKAIVYMALPLGVFVGVIAWLLARRFVTPCASGLEKRAAGSSLAKLGAAGESVPPRPSWGKRYGWLWTLVLRLHSLLLLLIATVAYVELWYIPIKFFARL